MSDSAVHSPDRSEKKLLSSRPTQDKAEFTDMKNGRRKTKTHRPGGVKTARITESDILEYGLHGSRMSTEPRAKEWH